MHAMNCKIQKKVSLNNSYIRLLIYYPIIYMIFSFGLVVFIMSVNPNGSKSFMTYGLVMMFLLHIYLFIKDREALKMVGLVSPSWGWYPLFPVYLFRRQYLNNLSFGLFYIHIIFLIIITFFAVVGNSR